MWPGVNITNWRGARSRSGFPPKSVAAPAPAMPHAWPGVSGARWAMNEISSLSNIISGRTQVRRIAVPEQQPCVPDAHVAARGVDEVGQATEPPEGDRPDDTQVRADEFDLLLAPGGCEGVGRERVGRRVPGHRLDCSRALDGCDQPGVAGAVGALFVSLTCGRSTLDHEGIERSVGAARALRPDAVAHGDVGERRRVLAPDLEHRVRGDVDHRGLAVTALDRDGAGGLRGDLARGRRQGDVDGQGGEGVAADACPRRRRASRPRGRTWRPWSCPGCRSSSR